MQELLERIRKLYEAADMLGPLDSDWTEAADVTLKYISQGDVVEAGHCANLMRNHLSWWSSHADWDSPDTEEKFLELIGQRF